MRHRRGFFSRGRGHHGNDRENRSHFRERMLSHEPLSHREERMPSCEQSSRRDERKLSREPLSQREERMPSREPLSNREERMLPREQLCHREEWAPSREPPFLREEKDYHVDRSRYGSRTDTRHHWRSLGSGDVNIGLQGNISRYDLGTNGDISVESFRTYLNNKYCEKGTGQQLGTHNSHCFQLDIGNSSLYARDTSKNRENDSSQIETNKNNIVLEQPWDVSGRMQPYQVPRGFHEGAVNRGLQFDCKSWRDFDQRNQKELSSRCHFDEDLKTSGHKSLHTVTETDIEKMGTNKKNVSIFSYETSSFQDQVCGRSLKNDFRRPSRFQPVTVSSPCVRNSIYGRPFKTNQFGPYPFMQETFQSVNQALFTRNGQPISRRDEPPCPIGLSVTNDCISSLHEGKRNQMGNVPEILKDVRQNTYWTNQTMHAINKQLNCRPKEQFKPVCITEALNFAHHANNVPKVNFPTNKMSFGQYTGNISTLQGDSVDVAMIPLPLEPPPPPPPPPIPPLQELVPQTTNIHIPSTVTSPILTGTKNEFQKTVPDLSENQVSSTSVDQDQVSLPEPEGSLKTDSQERPEKNDLLQESKKQKYENKNKVMERECNCSSGEDMKQHEFSKESSIKEEHILSSEVKISDTAVSCGNFARMSRCKNSAAKCDKDETCNNKLDQDANLSVIMKTDTAESTKSLNMEVAYAKADCRNNVKTTTETFKKGHHSKDDFAADKDCTNQPGYMHRKSSRQMKGNVRSPERLHRPWERDQWRNRTLKRFENDLSNHQRYQWSFWPLYNQKPYDRYFHHNKRLSGLGINTYHSNLEPSLVRERPSFSTLGYFRPWEKRESTRWGIALENDQAKKLHKSQFSQNSSTNRREAEYWRDCSLELNECPHNGRNVDTGNAEGKSLMNSSFVVKTNDLMDTQVAKAKDTCNTNYDHKVTKQNGPNSVQENMVAVFRERPKNKESVKCDILLEEKYDKKPADHKENSSQNEIPGSAQNENSAKSAMEEPNDRFAKTREDRYNHGHSYSEILAVKSKTHQNKKKREKIIDEKSLVNKHYKKRNNFKKNTDSLKADLKEKTLNSLKGSDFLKTTPVCDVKMSVPKTTEISKLSFSEVVKPDCSVEKKLREHEKGKKGLKSYKIPHLSTYKNLVKSSSKSSEKMRAEEKDALKETKVKKKDQKNNLFVKPGIIRSLVKSHDEKKYRRVLEKVKMKNKMKTKTGKEKAGTQTLKSLHPKLRHKFAVPSVGYDKNGHTKPEKKNLKIIVEKCDIGNSVDKSKVDNDRFHYSKSKCNENSDLNSKTDTELDKLKLNPSLLTRGKFILSTPNTFEVKKSKMKETVGKRTNTTDDTEEMGTLDKALLSAKKHLLYRALAVNALKRDKTKPLAKKKFGARKSPITTDMAKQELTILKETLTAETEKSPDLKNENSYSVIKGKKIEDNLKTSSFVLDFPTTVYQPQRTAIGNYATQCLFGPIVSSTFYKAPGKSRVVRNSTEIVTGSTKCREDFRESGVESQQHVCDSVLKQASNIETSKIGPTVLDGEITGTSLVDDLSANSVNSDEKRVDVNNNENLLALRSENQSCMQEKLQDSSLHTKKWSMPVALNTENPHFVKLEKSKDEIQAFTGVYDSQEKELDWKESELKKAQFSVCNSPFLQSNSDTYTVSDQFEMHRRYLKCKQELAESCFSPSEMKMPPTVVLPPVLPTLPFNTSCISDAESRSEFPIHDSNSVTENDLNVKNTTAGECYSSNGLDINNNSEETGNICLQYEPSNEEFEMYRSYQIQRSKMNAEGGVKTQYGQISNFVTSPEWKCVPNKQACFGSPYDTTKHEKNLSGTWDYNKKQDFTSKNCYTISEDLASADTIADPNISGGIYVNVSCEEKVSDQDSVLYSDGGTKFDQKPNCSIMNTEEELQDTSKDLFEDLFTDILKDEELISSIPIHPPDITKEETNLCSERNQTNESLSLENIKKEYVSPEIPLLSPKCSQQEILENEKSVQAKYEKEQKSAFKSARTPVHLTTYRKPKFAKRFPKPLPRARSHKLTAERELYEAAERFLGDFDHSHKRACCKDKFELLINPFTGKMEAVKIESRNQNELALKSVQSEDGELSKSKKLEIKGNKVDKDSDGKHSKTNSGLKPKRSPDSGRVTRQQIAIKKGILKPVKQKLKTKLKTDDSKGISVKKTVQCKRSSKTENSVVPNKRIPNLKLKAVGRVGTTGKWQVRSECDGKKEKVKSKLEDIKKFKVHKSESVGNKSICNKHKKENDSQKEDTIQERARVWTYKKLCKVCTYSCDNHLMLKLHYEKKHPLQCYKCENKFKDEDACKFHISESHSAGNTCELCGASFKNKWRLKRHLKSGYHMENQKRAEAFKTGDKTKTNITEAVVISDDDDDDGSCMEVINVNNEINIGTDSRAGRFGTKKSKTDNSQKFQSNTLKERKRKSEDESVTEVSEEEVEVKKAKCLVYCNVCRQYYKKIYAHFKTRKHQETVEEQKKAGTTTAGSQEVVHTLTIDDTDQETSTQTDDDMQNEEDVQTYEGLSPSSERSVVIVSDHDSHCGFEDDSNILDDSKNEVAEEDGQICDKNGQLKLSEQSQGQPQTRMICHDSLKSKKHEQNLKSAPEISEKNTECIDMEVDGDSIYRKDVQETRVKCDGEDANTDFDLEKKVMPVVVSSGQEGVCSPTMLVKNIAADLMCRKDVSVRQNIFDRMSSGHKCMKVCSPNLRSFENSLESGKSVKGEHDTDAEETISEAESSNVKNKTKKHILETESGSWETEKVVIVEMVPDDGSMPVESKVVEIVCKGTGSTDCQITENP